MIRQYSTASFHSRLQHSTIELWENIVSPFCGILNSIFGYHRQSYDPKNIAIAGELADVARYKGFKKQFSYHIGGISLNRDDAMIKCLAESYERYISVMIDPETFYVNCFSTYDEMHENGKLLPDQRLFHYFEEDQYKQNNFFTKFDTSKPFLWVQTHDIVFNKITWLPAQLVFLGYLPKVDQGEVHINSAVSTGTAVHCSFENCLLNSLLEMILIDAVVGHWYTDTRAYKIEFDKRTRHIERIIDKSIPHHNLNVEFYWIPSVDFSTFNVACTAHSEYIPKFSIGLGADTTLQGAMYKAFLEFLGTRLLGHTLALTDEKLINSNHIENLDDNVLLYAQGYNKKRIYHRFNPKISAHASDLPADLISDKKNVFHILLNEFKKVGKNVGSYNLTTMEARDLGLVATKLWSPQLLTIPVPHAVPINHPRFYDYGGVTHHDPHPYP